MPSKRTKLPPIRSSIPPAQTPRLSEEEKDEMREAFAVPGDDPGDGHVPPQYQQPLTAEEERYVRANIAHDNELHRPVLPPEVDDSPTLGELQAHAPPPPPSSVIASQFSDVPIPPPDLTVPPVPRPLKEGLPTPEVFRTPAPPPVAALPDWISTGTIGREIAAKVIPPTPTGRYVARIEVLDVYQYPGTLGQAPDWIDRNWTAYADQDETRHPPLPGGPALAIPGAGLCRKGWYVVREVVTIEEGMTSERLAVYEPDVFYHWFRPAGPLHPDGQP